jgi:hypothetical protein
MTAGSTTRRNLRARSTEHCDRPRRGAYNHLMTSSRRNLCVVALCAAAGLGAVVRTVHATGVPIDGFLPQVGISLTRDFVDDITIAPAPKATMTEPQLGPGGTPYYEVALFDTGAAVSILNATSRAAFGIDAPYTGAGGSDGFTGSEIITIGGASGFVDGDILDLLGLYAGGLQSRTAAGASLVMNTSAMLGQTNTSMVAVPPESDLPSVLGFSFISQYATRIRSDQPQLFQVAGQTVRTPSIEFLPRGSGGMGIARKAALSLDGQSPVTPQHVPNLFDPGSLETPWEDPVGPTFVSGGMFMNISVEDDVAGDGGALTNTPFFFDTGASVTVVSQANAQLLGFDVVLDEPEFTLAVVGAGGATLDVPGFFADKFTIQAIGGNIVATNVPIVVLDIADPADPNNVIAGFVGSNLLNGRNLVIDPNPASSGGPSAGLYISDPVTTAANWNAAAQSASWATGGSWSSSTTPDVMTIANLRQVAAAAQTAVVSASATAWEVNVSGAAANKTMTLAVQPGVTLTTFSGLNIEPHGVVSLSGAVLDVQYVDIRNGGRLTGSGSIATGSGPIPGQVENYSGVVAPGVGVGALNIEGRFTNGAQAVLEMEIGGVAPGSGYDQLVVDGDVTLAGVLNVSLVNLFTPAIGSAFTLLSVTGDVAGQFDMVNLPPLPGDRMWTVAYTSTSLSLKVAIPGDFDANGSVQPVDLAAWKAGFGQHYGGAGFLLWQRNQGMGAAPATSTPEPGAAVLGVVGLVGIALQRRSGGL